MPSFPTMDGPSNKESEKSLSSDKSIHLDGRSVGQRSRRVLGYAHEEHFGQLLDEEAPDPRRDFVGGRFTVADVEDDDGDEDRQSHQTHGEEQVFAQEGHGQRG